MGKEIVTGHRQDANVRTIARYLVKRGIEIRGVRMVADDPDQIAGAVRSACCDLLVTSGGLGSTRDDVTASAVAAALALPLEHDPAMKARVREKLRRRGAAWAPRHAAFARKPRGAEALANSAGLAEGLLLPGTPAVLMLPGVPAELEAIVGESLDAALDRRFGAARIEPPHVLGVAGLRETEIEDACLDLPAFRRGEVSILPSPGTVQLVLRGNTLRDEVLRRLGDAVFTVGGESLAAVVFRELVRRGQVLATAESCTGGLLGAALTDLPGVSSAYRGGVIVYADESKTALLGVDPRLIARHGAVSRQVAEAMAIGVCERLGADWGVGITGVAGPGGGTAHKPVGLVYIGVAGAAASRPARGPGEPAPARGGRRPFSRVIRLRLGGNRAFIRRHAVARALDLLRRALGGLAIERTAKI